MNYEQTLEYLYHKLPVFQKVGKSAYKPGLERIEKFLFELQNPQNNLKTIHIAGTNGKGSVSHMLASVFKEAGFKTGLYTSPHLLDFRERIKINGRMISKKYVTDFVQHHKKYIEQLEPSFFEVTVAMAMLYFKEKNSDINIIETGLGGRLDSTNIILPEISIITNISYDHMDILGNTLEKIAWEKAGIIKQHKPVIVGEKISETEKVFVDKAKEKQAPLYFAEEILCKEKYSSDLTGIYQQKNIHTVCVALQVLNNMGYNISAQVIKKGLKNVVKNTGLMGRWQTIQEKPLIICDTGHNESGIKQVVQGIMSTHHQKLFIIFGAVKDKDINNMLSSLPTKAYYLFCTPEIFRGKNAHELMQDAKKHELTGDVYENMGLAIEKALQLASAEDLIFVGGSTFIVADFLKYWKQKKYGSL